MIEFRTRNLLAASVAAVLLLGMVPDANAQLAKQRNERFNEEQKARNSSGEKEEAKFPGATREEPKAEGSSKLRKTSNAMINAYNDDQFAEARAKAAEVMADPDANDYDRALAAQINAHAALDMDDNAGAIASLKQAVDLDALGNNAHFGSMVMLPFMEYR